MRPASVYHCVLQLLAWRVVRPIWVRLSWKLSSAPLTLQLRHKGTAFRWRPATRTSSWGLGSGGASCTNAWGRASSMHVSIAHPSFGHQFRCSCYCWWSWLSQCKCYIKINEQYQNNYSFMWWIAEIVSSLIPVVEPIHATIHHQSNEIQ